MMGLFLWARHLILHFMLLFVPSLSWSSKLNNYKIDLTLPGYDPPEAESENEINDLPKYLIDKSSELSEASQFVEKMAKSVKHANVDLVKLRNLIYNYPTKRKYIYLQDLTALLLPKLERNLKLNPKRSILGWLKISEQLGTPSKKEAQFNKKILLKLNLLKSRGLNKAKEKQPLMTLRSKCRYYYKLKRRCKDRYSDEDSSSSSSSSSEEDHSYENRNKHGDYNKLYKKYMKTYKKYVGTYGYSYPYSYYPYYWG